MFMTVYLKLEENYLEDKLDGLITKLEGAIQSENYSEMKELNESIKNTMMEIGQQVYSQTPNGEDGPPNAANDDAIETDFSAEK